MELCTLSVILPVKNLAKEIGGILRLAAEQTEGLSTELIVVDMASRDKTVWESLRSIKELNIPGAVIQSGDGTVASALNTALSRASGNYVSFVFARRLFRDFCVRIVRPPRLPTLTSYSARLRGSRLEKKGRPFRLRLLAGHSGGQTCR